MKCPNCEKWNRAGMPHCIYCGADLPQNAYNENGYLPWQQEMKTGNPSAVDRYHTRVSHHGLPAASDPVGGTRC